MRNTRPKPYFEQKQEDANLAEYVGFCKRYGLTPKKYVKYFKKFPHHYKLLMGFNIIDNDGMKDRLDTLMSINRNPKNLEINVKALMLTSNNTLTDPDTTYKNVVGTMLPNSKKCCRTVMHYAFYETVARLYDESEEMCNTLLNYSDRLNLEPKKLLHLLALNKDDIQYFELGLSDEEVIEIISQILNPISEEELEIATSKFLWGYVPLVISIRDNYNGFGSTAPHGILDFKRMELMEYMLMGGRKNNTPFVTQMSSMVGEEYKQLWGFINNKKV